MKRNIIAIGGGRIMVPKGQNPQTLAIDKEILRLCRRKKPRFLFFPTASLDDEACCERIKNHFGEKLGCRVETLLLYRQRPNAKVIKNKILNAGIISMKNKNAWKVYWCRGQYFREKMAKNGKFQALAGLLQKKYDKHLPNVFLIFPSCHIVLVQTISAAFQNRRLSCQV